MSTPDVLPRTCVSISVVVPVYRGVDTLAALVDEIAPLIREHTTPGGIRYRVGEVLLVWDRGPDDSESLIRALASGRPWVRAIWLSRNYGQHPATLAGMASSSGDWVATLDEDGQHDPADLGRMLDTAVNERLQLVYGVPDNPPPHGRLRNLASRATKALTKVLAEEVPSSFSSYRLIMGEIARSVAAYVSHGVYLDVALSWVAQDVGQCSTRARAEGRLAGSYTYRRLASHFWRLVISSGTRPLRLVSAMGCAIAFAGVILSAWFVYQRINNDIPIEGWTSVMVAVLMVGGATLVALGVIAEYVGAALRTSLGRPLYITVRDPAEAFPPPLSESRP